MLYRMSTRNPSRNDYAGFYMNCEKYVRLLLPVVRTTIDVILTEHTESLLRPCRYQENCMAFAAPRMQDCIRCERWRCWCLVFVLVMCEAQQCCAIATSKVYHQWQRRVLEEFICPHIQKWAEGHMARTEMVQGEQRREQRGEVCIARRGG